MNSIEQLIRTNIRLLKPYSSAREEFSGTEGIFLDANESPFGSWNRYPDPFQTKLKQRLGQLKSVPADCLFLGNGSDEIIDLCFRLFCEPYKHKALTFVPTYGMYEVSASINNVELIEVGLNENFQIETESVLPLLQDDDLKLIFICSPNNPTGNTIDRIEFVLENFNGIVVVDEAYIDFSKAGSLSKKIEQYPNLIVIQTLSKAWGLASLRIGIAITNPEIIAFLNKIKPPYNISQPNQQLALEVLNQQVIFENKKKQILEQKEIVRTALSGLAFVCAIYPSETNFLLIRVTDADALYNRLLEAKIIIRNRDKVVKDCLRITIGTPEENNALIATLNTLEL